MTEYGEKFKHAQKAAWTEVAEGWHTGLAPSLAPVSDKLVSLVQIPKGAKVLDLACGDGTLTLKAAAAGADEVTGLDIAPTFEAILMRRAKKAGLKRRVRFREGDLEHLPFDEKTFDVVFCQFGLMFAPDLKAALQHIYRVIKPSGTLCAAVWGAAEENPALASILQLLSDRLPPRPAGLPGLFDYGEPHFMEKQLHAVGFRDYSESGMDVMFRLDSVDEAWTAWRNNGPFVSAMAQWTPEVKAEVERLAREIFERYKTKKGNVEIPSKALLLHGKRGFETLNYPG